MDINEFEALQGRCRNWGKWGPDDEIGTLNHVDSQAILGGRDCIRQGKVFSLALPYGREGPVISAAHHQRFNALHLMVRHGDDTLEPEKLAAGCAKDRQYDFLFVGSPLPVTSAVGSPVNPTAIK